MSAIGIVGGVGPSAGTDLAEKVFSHTKAEKDQDHINLYLVSCPSIVPDRTAYLLSGGDNPAPGIQKCIETLAACGATAVGISCNTAHSPKILSQVRLPGGIRFINMIENTCRYIQEKYPSSKIGILATLGTNRTGIYDEYFSNYPDLELVKLEPEDQKVVHDAIYNKEYGIKAVSPVSDKASDTIRDAVLKLKEKGCRAVILGCTELPLVFPSEKSFSGISLIDPTDVLATELVKSVAPEKLK